MKQNNENCFQWRGNLSNLILARGFCGPLVWAIDTTLCRRPPRLALRGDATCMPHSLARALTSPPEAQAKVSFSSFRTLRICSLRSASRPSIVTASAALARPVPMLAAISAPVTFLMARQSEDIRTLNA
jgi:hypothetical protein